MLLVIKNVLTVLVLHKVTQICFTKCLDSIVGKNLV